MDTSMDRMEISPIARIRNDYREKFGIPRQSGLVREMLSVIVFEEPYRSPEAFRGITDYSHLWLIWQFSAKGHDHWSPTVRPPILGGNTRMGVFATRSPFRPNRLGLSCVELIEYRVDEQKGPILVVAGADLMDDTPIIDIKPYLPYADAHPEARGGFGEKGKPRCRVEIPEEMAMLLGEETAHTLAAVLAEDPKPSYQHEKDRIYGMHFGNYNVRFRYTPEGIQVVQLEAIE